MYSFTFIFNPIFSMIKRKKEMKGKEDNKEITTLKDIERPTV